jgi:glycine C-acetyltransferase
VLDLLDGSTALRDKLEGNTRFFREEMSRRGFDIIPGSHPIVPIILGDAALAVRFADAMLRRGVYVIGFSFPVVPKARRAFGRKSAQVHSREDLVFGIEQFSAVKAELGL